MTTERKVTKLKTEKVAMSRRIDPNLMSVIEAIHEDNMEAWRFWCGIVCTVVCQVYETYLYVKVKG